MKKIATVKKVETKNSIEKPAKLPAYYYGIAGAVLFVFLMFLGWNVARLSNDINEMQTAQVEVAVDNEMAPLASQSVTVRSTLTPYVDPQRTPGTVDYEEFIYTGFEIANRGGTSWACPYRSVSVRDAPSITGTVVGCLFPNGIWNFEEPFVHEGNNVWACVAMQVTDSTCHKWIALQYGTTYFTNWRK